MSEHDNELRKALADNGTFDAEKGKKITADAVSRFHAELKKNERFLRVSLLISVGVLAFAIEKLFFAASTKAIVGFGVILLFVLVTTVLLKLWYWIVNTRITLQKELKVWQLQTAMAWPSGGALSEMPPVVARDSADSRGGSEQRGSPPT